MQEIWAPKEDADVHLFVVLTHLSCFGRWERAVEAKENAREDNRLAENERVQSITKAETRLKVGYCLNMDCNASIQIL